MAEESQKFKSKTGEVNLVESNVHPFPLKPRMRKGVHEAAPFSDLASRLEKRIGRIESELKESIQMLEGDIRKALKDKKINMEEKVVKEELNTLSQQLETRLQRTLKTLTLRQKVSKDEEEKLKVIRKLSSNLIKILSFDFYKGVLNRLGLEESYEETDPFGEDPRLIATLKPIFDYLYYRYWRIATTGIENIPNEGCALVVANHSGTIPYDGAMIKTAILNEHSLRKDVRFLVEDFVYHMPMLGTLMYRIGGVRACQENAELLLSKGHLVVVFPEGVKGIGKFYKHRYKLQRFGRGGFIKLCMKTESPLIPVGIVGAEEIHPILFKSNTLAKTIGVPYIPITPTFPLLGPLGLIPFPTKWSIHFGKPFHFKTYGPKAVDDELLIHKLSEGVRDEIQKIIMDLLKKRRSVWLG